LPVVQLPLGEGLRLFSEQSVNNLAPILFSHDAEESAEIMVTAARQLRRARSTAYCRPGYRPKGWRKRALFILQGLPNIGPRRAQALLEAFGSVRAVMSATPRALAGVDGIGVGAAASIIRATGDEPPPPPIEPIGRTLGRDWQGRRRGRSPMTR